MYINLTHLYTATLCLYPYIIQFFQNQFTFLDDIKYALKQKVKRRIKKDGFELLKDTNTRFISCFQFCFLFVNIYFIKQGEQQVYIILSLFIWKNTGVSFAHWLLLLLGLLTFYLHFYCQVSFSVLQFGTYCPLTCQEVLT